MLATLRSEIASLDRARNAIAGAVGRLYRTLDDGYDSLPSAAELADDVAVLQARYTTASKKGSPKLSDLVDAAYLEELEKLAGQLKASPSGGTAKMHSLHSPFTAQEPRIERLSQLSPDVKAELERAGRTDRLLLLQAQEISLDDVRFPPLTLEDQHLADIYWYRQFETHRKTFSLGFNGHMTFSIRVAPTPWRQKLSSALLSKS